MDHRIIDSRSAFSCKPSSLWIRFDHRITIKGPLVPTRYKSSRYSNVNSDCTIQLVDARVSHRRYSHLDVMCCSQCYVLVCILFCRVLCSVVFGTMYCVNTNDVRFESPSSSIFFFWLLNLVSTRTPFFCLSAPGPVFSVDNLSSIADIRPSSPGNRTPVLEIQPSTNIYGFTVD